MGNPDSVGETTRRSQEYFSPDGEQSAILSSATDFLAGGGEMGARIRAMNWSATPLGPVESWPQSLKTIVRIMLTSRQPIWIGWGPELIKLYNDPYKAIVGGKHPEALGQPAAVVWHEIWDDVGPRLQTTLQTNEGTYDESLLLIMERYGYPEETYYTFSYSPVPGDHGGVEGIICANTDDTQRIIGERQLKLLRTLAAATADARTIADACRLSSKSLEHNPYDLPFAMIYLLAPEKQAVYLAGTSGIAKDHPAVPATVALNANSIWPFADVINNKKVRVIANLEKVFDDLPTGAWKRPPHQAVAVPIAPSGQTGKAGVLIVGLNPFRLLDESYQGFINLVAGRIAASLANAQAYEEERKRAEALAEIDRAKTLFFSNVSHEFRTPLTLMLGPIEDTLAEKNTLSQEQYERMEILHRNSLRLLKLVNALLDFSRIEASRVQATYEPTDLAALTADLASNFRAAIEKAGMQLLVDCPPLTKPVYVDHEMWEKIVLNLLSNAFKYTLKGKITVTLRQKSNAVELAVQDTGVGIPAEELPHMFERFHRVKGTEGRTYEGTGIGLSLVQELVKLHGGTIDVKSTVGKGSTFTVTIPLGSDHLPQDHIAARQIHAARMSGTNIYIDEALRLLPEHESIADIILDVPLIADGRQPADDQLSNGERGQGARVLLADDNADMREYVSRLLADRYQVKAVPDGRAALEAVEEYRPDLVLTDVMMPGMDGFELLQAIRSNPQTSTLPVIMLSARAGEEASIEGMKAGADDYLVKPFSARELMARVGAHLEMARIRKEAEASIEESEARFRALADNIPNLVWMARPDGWIYWYNSRWYEYTGTTPEQMQGWGWQAVHDPEILPSVMERWQNSLSSGEPFAMVFPLKSAQGEFHPFLTRIVPIHDNEGTIVQWFGTNTDITEQKRLEQQKDEFIGIASHELKTPVTSIKAYAQLLERRFRRMGDESSSQMLRKMDAQLNKLTNLIRDLLDVTKIESGKLQLHKSSFDLNELIAEIVEETQRTATNHAFIQELSASAMLYADRDRIGQVLTNLLTNAVKYSPEANTIVIRTIHKDGAIITSVQDFGIGIPEEEQSQIFERFFRVDGAVQETYPGLGLGLYISSEFIKRHHGTIWVESKAGKGSTFSFSLPIEKVKA
ncbi:MAG TPA: ATP-binding protein [Ktedonosporobacter sp.]|jgi:PAS domain S-box-containing protein|nr:ATP-binding protein [Ktedonosporobacter sp.]